MFASPPRPRYTVLKGWLVVPDLLILGANAHAVEMAEIADRINQVNHTWDLIGFVSQYDDQVGEILAGLRVLDRNSAMEQYSTALVVPEYEWPHKSEIPRHRLTSLIDPSVFVSKTAHIGQGCVIFPNCYVGAYASIGDFLFCLSGTVINHNDIIEDRVTLTSDVILAGNVYVEADCYVGQSCSVRELCRVGRGSLIGMGAVLLHDAPPNSVMVGNPARRLRARERNYPGKRLVLRARHAAGKVKRRMMSVAADARVRHVARDEVHNHVG